MRYALDTEYRRIHALDAEKSEQYICPLCGSTVIPRQGSYNAWHFAHQTSCLDSWTYDMSEWHLNWQQRFPAEYREIVVESHGERHRADVLIDGFVIEFQHSPISADEVDRRNRFYQSAGYKVIWVFDAVDACDEDLIQPSDENCDKYTWKYANKAMSSICPQYEGGVAVILQLAEPESDDKDDLGWLVKVEWAIPNDDGGADYKRFFVDGDFYPDVLSDEGRKLIMMNKRKRFAEYLRGNQPYRPKCSRIKGNPRDWYICEKTGTWHDQKCQECHHNLIREYRKGTDYQRGGLFYYCCYPRIVHKMDDTGVWRVPSISL